MCTILKDIGISKEKGMYLPSKESISGHRCERINRDIKYKMFMNCNKNIIGIYKKKQI